MKMVSVATMSAFPRPRQANVRNGADVKGSVNCLDAPHMLPDHDTPALVCYSAQASDVCMTMVDGKILYENGEYLTMDKERIFHDYRASCEYLASK